MFEDFRLRVFVRVAELGSFTAAARALGITQPAVSQHIAELEKFAGGLLFERSRGHIDLTARGERLLGHARGILGEYKQLENEFRVPESILLRSVLLDGRKTNILIRHDRFADLDTPADTPADRILEADGTAIFPSFFDASTWSASILWRGAEAGPLTPEAARRGDELAIREMGASGTTFFADLGSEPEETVAAVEASGLRAAIGIPVDGRDASQSSALRDYIKNWKDPTGGCIQLLLAPRNPLTLSPEQLKRLASFARHQGLLMHIRLAATQREAEACVRAHGATPVRYLDKLGFLGGDVIAAGCVQLDPEEWKILGRRSVTVVHCPASEMRQDAVRFPYALALESGCRIALGTDGADHGSLDLHDPMKYAALLAGPQLPPEVIFRWATRSGAEAFGIDAGQIAAGKQADAVLVDLGSPRMQPGHDLLANWVLSADSSAIRHVLCAGRLLTPHASF